jgi:nucleotidyltransferase substrate binding protein (TIGR01987 family)
MREKSVENFLNTVSLLQQALASPIMEKRDLAGIVLTFKFTYETSWKALKQKLEHLGITSGPPRDVFAKGYQASLLDDEEIWLSILKDRNLTTHTYNESLAQQMVERIRSRYLAAFEGLSKKLQAA